MDIPPDQEKDLKNVYGKGAKMLLKMGLQAGHLENSPVETSCNVGRQGLGFFSKDSPNPFKKPSQPGHSQSQRPTGSKQSPNSPTFSSSQFRARTSYHNRKGKKLDPDLPLQAAGGRSRSCPNELEQSFKNLAIDSAADDSEDYETIKDNIRLITDRCEEEILKNSKKIHSSSDELVILKKMETDISRRINSQQRFIADLEKLKDIISSGSEDTKEDNEQRLNDYFCVFKAIKDNEFVWEKLEFYRYIAPLIVSPIKKEIGTNWDPLKNPIKPAQLYVQWNHLLIDKPEEFEIILRETYMAPLKESIRNWDGENPQQIAQIIKIWSQIFPSSMINEIQDSVWPKFNALVSRWDPSDQSQCNSCIVSPIWVLEWEKLFDSKFHVATQKICDKIEMTLGKWHPSRNWATETVCEWEHLLDDRQMDRILQIIAIILENNLKKMTFDIANSDTEAADATLLWKDFLSPGRLANIFGKSFFPNWLRFIDTWLKSETNYTEVSHWYSFWRNRIPDEMWTCSEIQDNFTKALELIDSALDTQGVVDKAAALSLQDSASTSLVPCLPKPETKSTKEDKCLVDADKFMDPNPTIFRDFLQKKCAENGIIFFPLGTKVDGKQIYRCKKHSIYLDSGVIYIKREKWTPISMDDLFNL